MKKIALLLMVNLFFFIGIARGQPVRIAYLQSDIHQLPCWVALEKGFFEKEGVKVEKESMAKDGSFAYIVSINGKIHRDLSSHSGWRWGLFFTPLGGG